MLLSDVFSIVPPRDKERNSRTLGKTLTRKSSQDALDSLIRPENYVEKCQLGK